MAITKAVLKVVLVSPGDVKFERESVARVKDDVNRILRRLEKDAELDLWQWETDTYPGFHPLGPQGQVDNTLKIEDADLVIGIFWRRFGTPTQDALSGTEHELRKAYRCWKDKGTPQIMLYFCAAAGEPQTSAQEAQAALVAQFRTEFAGEAFVFEYENPSQFEERLRDHLLQASVEQLKRLSEQSRTSAPVTVRTTPALLRAEGLTEAIGDIVIRVPAGSRVEHSFSILISFGTTVTNRITSGNLTDAFLFEDGNPSFPITRGSRVVPNIVMFGPIEVAGQRLLEERTFVVHNVRLAVAALGAGSREDAVQVLAKVQITDLPIDQSTITAARILSGLVFRILGRDGKHPVPPSGVGLFADEDLPLQRVATLRYSETFPDAFKTRAHAPFGPVYRHHGEMLVYVAESSHRALPVQTAGSLIEMAGIADNGTCLQARFENVPAGLRLFVPLLQTASSAGLRARLVEPNDGDRGDRAAGTGGTVEVQLKNGEGTAVWEICGREPHHFHPVNGELDVGVWATFAAHSAENSPACGTCTVTGSFAPPPKQGRIAAWFNSGDRSVPVPRFLDTSTGQSLFQIQRGRR